MTERRRIAASFDAASDYDAHAVAQRRIAIRLAELLASRRSGAPATIVELGCGTGFLTRELRARFPAARLHASDLAPAMLARARRALAADSAIAWALLDGEYGPYPAAEWIVSSLCAQWFDDLGASLRRQLRAAPLVAFSTLVDGTFAEWVDARRRMGHDPGVRQLVDAALLAPLATNAGAARVSVERETVSVTYASALAFLRALRAVGATTPRADHRPSSLQPLLRAHTDGFVANYRVAYVVAER